MAPIFRYINNTTTSLSTVKKGCCSANNVNLCTIRNVCKLIGFKGDKRFADHCRGGGVRGILLLCAEEMRTERNLIF